jgi:hypothetical protein
VPYEHGTAQLGLELLHVKRHGGGPDAEPICGPGEVAGLDDGPERCELPKIHDLHHC